MGRELAEKETRPVKKGRFKTLAGKVLLFAAGMLILYLAALQALHLVIFKMIDTGSLDRGELKKLYTAEGIIIRNETVITSPADGELVMLVKEDSRVRAGDSIAEIRTAGADPGMPAMSVPVSATTTGVVSSRVDGLEGLLKPDQTDIFDAGRLQKAASRLQENGSQGPVKSVKGQPVLKIIDNLTPIVMCIRIPGGLPPGVVKKGGGLYMIRDDTEITGRIDEIGHYNGGTQLVVETSNYPTDFLHTRDINMQLAGDRIRGFIVDSSSLTARNGQQGLFLMDRDEVKWTPVKVVGTVSGKSAVEGKELETGAPYVKNPRWLKFAGE